jgi:predicted choloylglycine hydrolase
MCYTVGVIDGLGTSATVFLSPDRPADVVPDRAATNHQRQIEWPAYAAATATLERHAKLERLLAEPGQTLAGLIEHFLEPPLYATQWSRSFGTLYTVVYRPVERTVTFVWPGARVEQSFDAFEERELVVPFGA